MLHSKGIYTNILASARREAAQLPLYLKDKFRLDLLAGLTVAMVAVPQSMAYAAIAGVNPIYGLYAAIVPAVVGAVLGSSQHLVTGPSNATALATAGILIAFAGKPEYIEFVFALAIASGLVKLLLGLLNLGSIIRYVSNSVLTGFLAGAGVLIIINQLGNLLGIARPSGAGPVNILIHLFSNLARMNPFILATGLFTVLVYFSVKHLHRGLPAALIAIIGAGALVQFAGWERQGVVLVNGLSSLDAVGLKFHIPQIPWSQANVLVASAGAVALLSLVEAMSVAKSFGLSSGQHVQSSREFIGQGAASILGGLFQGIPSSGSPSRTAVNFSSGAQTRWAAAFSGGFVLAAILLFSKFIGYIPIASLAGVVIISAIQMIDRHHIQLTWQTRLVSRVVLLATFSAALLLPLHIAIYLGGVLSIAIYLYESSRLELSYLKLDEKGRFVEYSMDDLLREHPQVAIINVEGALYFGAVDDLEEHLEEVLASGVKVLVLRMRRTRLLASTGVTTLEGLVTRANQVGVSVFICGLSEDIEETLNASGIEKLLGEQHTFLATHTLFESTHKALQRARELMLQEQC